MSKKAIYAEDLLCSIRDDPSINGAHFARIRRHIEAATAVDVPKTPCDLCRHNPPSSLDGKPCTICAAEGRVEDVV